MISLNDRLRIATRTSPLAMWQAHHVGQRLGSLGIATEIKGFSTKGDRVQDRFLHEIGGKGLFIKELQQAMLNDEADLAVHSLKDLPAKISDGFSLAAVLQRHDPRDQLIMHPKHKTKIEELSRDPLLWLQKHKSVVATASLRRAMLLKHLCPAVRVEGVRGNVNTRIGKLEESEDWDALILARASLDRLQLHNQLVTCPLDPEIFIPSPAQGVLAVEVVSTHPARAGVEQLDDFETRRDISVERGVLAALGADCTLPVACFAKYQDGVYRLQAAVLSQHHRADALIEEAIEEDQIDVYTWVDKAMQLLHADGLKEVLDELGLNLPKQEST